MPGFSVRRPIPAISISPTSSPLHGFTRTTTIKKPLSALFYALTGGKSALLWNHSQLYCDRCCAWFPRCHDEKLLWSVVFGVPLFVYGLGFLHRIKNFQKSMVFVCFHHAWFIFSCPFYDRCSREQRKQSSRWLRSGWQAYWQLENALAHWKPVVCFQTNGNNKVQFRWEVFPFSQIK